MGLVGNGGVAFGSKGGVGGGDDDEGDRANSPLLVLPEGGPRRT
jgi:hypothetical protein